MATNSTKEVRKSDHTVVVDFLKSEYSPPSLLMVHNFWMDFPKYVSISKCIGFVCRGQKLALEECVVIRGV